MYLVPMYRYWSLTKISIIKNEENGKISFLIITNPRNIRFICQWKQSCKISDEKNELSFDKTQKKKSWKIKLGSFKETLKLTFPRKQSLS